MKNLVFLFVVFFAVFTAVSFPQLFDRLNLSSSEYEKIEHNYLIGLNSGARGLQISSAYFLGEMRSQRALLPLMKMFRETKSEGEKILFAWSLLKIGDSRGVYLVKREREIGDCENIKCILGCLYMDYYLKTNSTDVAQN